ncbi:hypothetical protein H6K20_03365 [Staphylococcus epidermidis]|uniref:cytochrome P450 n=1 Tax=Staphylococcus epidermidis TaxID=1282 RepID=UPI001C40433E|nr:cytochrome P450 [Staphylococcus epidermidis]MBM6327987.1 hypothetical protein [Staphylococcus epidermidis]MBM6339585.1 hypothetical protein [Staphylococcus epidermidis]MCE5045806.1 hypothetical protein [Staphylococcus epidermidis]
MNKEFEIDNLNFKQINAMKILERDLKRDPFLLINFNELVNDLIFERNSYKKQRDELINDMAEIKKKAKAFDEILDINIDKDELLSEEYIEKVNDVIQEWIFN